MGDDIEDRIPHPDDDSDVHRITADDIPADTRTDEDESDGDTTEADEEDPDPVEELDTAETNQQGMPDPDTATTDDEPPAEAPLTVHVHNHPTTVDRETTVNDLKEMFPDVEGRHTAVFEGRDGQLYRLNDGDLVVEYLDNGDSLAFRFGDDWFGHTSPTR